MTRLTMKYANEMTAIKASQPRRVFMFRVGKSEEEGRIVRPNVGANRPAEAGGESLARDSGEAAARQAYAACRRGSG